MRAEEPDGRQECLVGVLLVEASFHELMHAYAEQAFTWRQLVRAMHRRDCTRGRNAWRINRFAEVGEWDGQPVMERLRLPEPAGQLWVAKRDIFAVLDYSPGE